MDPVKGGVQTRRVSGGLPIDQTTFDRFQAGDPGAMEAVVVAFRRRLIGFICLYTRSREIAEEVAQEVFLDAYRQRKDVYGPDKLRPWLFALAKRKALKELRHKHYSAEISLERVESLSPSVEPTQDSGILDGQLRNCLNEALAALPTQERELIVLRYFGGLQIKELAEALSLPMGSVGVKLGRALQKVRRDFEQRGLGIDDFLPKE